MLFLHNMITDVTSIMVLHKINTGVAAITDVTMTDIKCMFLHKMTTSTNM